MTTVNNPQNEIIPENIELSIITESVIIKPEENKDIKFEEVISSIMSEPKLSEQIITESIAQEPVVSEEKPQEPEIPEPEPKPKTEIDHPMVEVQNKVQEVIDVINTHVASKTDEAAIEIVKDIVNEIASEDKVFIKDKIIVPFEKVALLAAKMSHDALSNLEQYAISGSHWWNSVWWIKVKAQMFVAMIYVLIGIVLGSYITTRIYEYRMDQNTELLSAMIYKGKIYDLKVRLQ